MLYIVFISSNKHANFTIFKSFFVNCKLISQKIYPKYFIFQNIGFFCGKSIPQNFYMIKILFDGKDNQSFSHHTRIIKKYFLNVLKMYNIVQKISAAVSNRSRCLSILSDLHIYLLLKKSY